MKLKFIFRTVVNSWGIKNKKCVVCKNLIIKGNLSCNYRREHFYKPSFSNTCKDFKYLRESRKLT